MKKNRANFYKLIKDQEWTALKKELTKLDIIDIIDLIERSNELQSTILFRFLPLEKAKYVLQSLDSRRRKKIIDGLAEHATLLTNLMNNMEPDDRTALFEELPGKAAQQLMQLLSQENRQQATQLLGYPEDSVGRLMTPKYVAVKSHFTVKETLQQIRNFGKDAETLSVVYVVDSDWRLINDLRIKDILIANPEDKIEDLTKYKLVVLNALDDQEDAVKVFKDYDRVALPVVDSSNTLLGIVTVDDILDVADEEQTEDFHRFVGVKDAIVNPLRASISFIYKKRIGWLMALVLMNVFSGYALSRFESVIETMVSLVFFLPLLIDSGGNAGSQSATLMIRSLGKGDVRGRDWIYLLGKEFAIALLLGLTMAVGVSIVASWRAPDIIPIVALTMVIMIIVGSIVGMLLPFIFTRLKLDPATASAPLITTICDISGVLIYFSMAKMYFGV